MKSSPKQPEKNATSTQPTGWLAGWFPLLFGAFLGLALVKFGNVVVLERFVERPVNGYEWALSSWPVVLGYWLLGTVAGLGLIVARWRTEASKWLIALPLVWLVWQFVAAAQTVDSVLTQATLKHIAACAVCFYLGVFALGRYAHPTHFWFGLVVGLAVVLANGFQQHFGGLEESRRYFYAYAYDRIASIPPEYLKRLESTRIFSTLFYPNALAGGLLLLPPIALAVIWNDWVCLTIGARRFVVGVMGVGVLACLYWSGSKGGWLLMLLLALMALLQVPFDRRWKMALIGLVLCGGLVGFGLKYAGFFRRGATSVTARFDYWRAAVRTAVANPAFGTGPGTFAIPYQKIKRPESEMVRLVHNDYLQQASDSGWVGFATYTAFVIRALMRTRPRQATQEPVRFAVWLGLLGWWLQGLMEFSLYVPALAWCAFAMMGWLLARSGKPFDKPPAGA